MSLHIRHATLGLPTQHTLEFRKNENEKVKEDVSVNVKENYVIYHVNDDDGEVSVMQDFNRVSISRNLGNTPKNRD